VHHQHGDKIGAYVFRLNSINTAGYPLLHHHCCTITKHTQYLAVFEHISNQHIDCIDDHSDLLSNHSICSIVLLYGINQKAKRFFPWIVTMPLARWSSPTYRNTRVLPTVGHTTWWSTWRVRMALPPTAGLVILVWCLLQRWNGTRRRNTQS